MHSFHVPAWNDPLHWFCARSILWISVQCAIQANLRIVIAFTKNISFNIDRHCQLHQVSTIYACIRYCVLGCMISSSRSYFGVPILCYDLHKPRGSSKQDCSQLSFYIVWALIGCSSDDHNSNEEQWLKWWVEWWQLYSRCYFETNIRPFNNSNKTMHGCYPHDNCLNRFLDQLYVCMCILCSSVFISFATSHRHLYDNISRMIQPACWAVQLEKI